MRRPIEAIVFDMDGVLVDTEPWWFESRQAVATSCGGTWTIDDERTVKGLNSRQWAARVARHLDRGDEADRIERAVIDEMLERYRQRVPPVIEPGVRAVQRLGERWPLAVASSSPTELIEGALTALGVRDRFRRVVSSDEVGVGKPDPTVYLEAARRLGTDPAACLVIEDSDAGVESALAAGMRVVLVPAAGHPAGEGARRRATLVLGSLDELDDARISELELRPDRSARPGRGRLLEPPQAPVAGWRRSLRYRVTKSAVSLVVRLIVRLRVDGLEHLPPGPSLLCFDHQSWADPFVAIAALPAAPRLYWFGPKEEDMAVGGRNRLMLWVGTAVPFKPAKTDLRETARRVEAVFDAGYRLGIFAEGRIHAREGELLPLQEGAVFFALRAGVPIVPVAILGTSWLGLGRTVRVRVGEPIRHEGRHDRQTMAALTARTWCALYELVQGYPERPRPGRFGRWLTELFNDWPEGERPSTTEGAVGPRRAGEPVVGPHGPCGGGG